MYRNIDEDERLLTMARRYWDEEDQLTETQLYWVLKNEGYSTKEIDNAISDYWSIILTILMVVLVIYVHSLINR